MIFREVLECPDYYISSCGVLFNTSTGKVVKGWENEQGYRRARLKLRNGCFRDYYIHRLVAAYWCENPNGLNEVDHLNERRSGNRCENLKWVSRRENMSFVHNKGLRFKNDLPAVPINNLFL